MNDLGDVELEERTASSSVSPGPNEPGFDSPSREVRSLPPIEGTEAWIFLAGSFVTEMICLGGAFSWSIFQSYLSTSPDSPLRDASSVTVSAIGTLLLSMIYFAPGLAGPFLRRYPHRARTATFAAVLLASGSLLVASFLERSAGALMVFVGLLHGIGVGVATTTYMMWLPQWFQARRGLANGIAFAGAGTGGLFFPPLFNATLKLGFGWTMRIWALIILIGAGTSLCFVKPRLPPALATDTQRQHAPNRWELIRAEFNYVTTPLWYLTASTTFAASAGLFAVSFYLATYCTSLGLSSSATSGVVSAFNGSGLLGEIVIGYACDRLPYPLVQVSIATIATLSTFLLLGFSHGLPTILLFTLLFGFAAGSWCATWSSSTVDIARLRNVPVDSVMLSLVFLRGVASLVGPLVAAALYQPSGKMIEKAWGGFGFGGLIAFVGSCMVALLVLSGVTGVVRKQVTSKS